MGCAAEAARQQGQASSPTRHRGRGTDPSPESATENRKRWPFPQCLGRILTGYVNPVLLLFTHNTLYLFNATVAINPLLLFPIMPSVRPSPHSGPASLQLLSLAHSFLSHYPACLRPIHFRFISYTTFSPFLPVRFCRSSSPSFINHHVLSPLPIMPAAPISPLFITLPLTYSDL